LPRFGVGWLVGWLVGFGLSMLQWENPKPTGR